MSNNPKTDEDVVVAFVKHHRDFGYGRMMQLISDLWRGEVPEEIKDQLLRWLR